MARFVYVVARDRRDLYERLSAEFAGQDDVAVILDRRHGDRRLNEQAIGRDARTAERRQQPEADDDLRRQGMVLTGCADLALVIVR